MLDKVVHDGRGSEPRVPCSQVILAARVLIGPYHVSAERERQERREVAVHVHPVVSLCDLDDESVAALFCFAIHTR